MADKFDKFTERARKVLTLANEEAQRFNHNYIGTEHILLGLLREGEGVAARVLVNLGVELTKVRSAVEFIIGRGDRMVMGEIGMTPRAKKVIELAVDEARRMKHNYIGTEHLLLGLVREGEGIAAGVLEALGVSLEKVRTQVIQVLNSSASYGLPSEVGWSASGEEQISLSTGLRAGATNPPRPPAQFTAAAFQVLRLAREEALAYNAGFLGPEQILLALLRAEDPTVTRMLTALDGDPAAWRAEAETTLRAAAPRAGADAGPTAAAEEVILEAADEALWLQHPAVGPEHLLLGLVRDGTSPAAALLAARAGSLPAAYLRLLHALIAPPE